MIRKKTVSRDRFRSSVTTSLIGRRGGTSFIAPHSVPHTGQLPSPMPELPVTPDDVARAAATIGGSMHRTPTFSSRSLVPRAASEGRALSAHRLLQGARRPESRALPSSRGAWARCDRGFGRQPRASPGVGGGHGGDRRAARDVERGERVENRRPTRAYGAEVDLEADGPVDAFGGSSACRRRRGASSCTRSATRS